jgi:hydrogenase nickel incorporation protein HypB
MEIEIARKVMEANQAVADQNRRLFQKNAVFVVNVMSSPGSGKTTTLEKTLVRLTPDIRCAVIVGDICTSNDADRLSRTGVPVIQINTDELGGTCHLSAAMIQKAVKALDIEKTDVLIVENVGNLVCPADMDIGEDMKVVVLSVTEGEDKPLKYPLMFRVCEAAILNKIDLLPYLDVAREAFICNILQIHPGIPVFQVSAKTEDGLQPWIDWLKARIREKKESG